MTEIQTVKNDEKIYTVTEASKIFGIARHKLAGAIDCGHVRYIQVPGKSYSGYVRYIPESAVKEYLADPKAMRMPIAPWRENMKKTSKLDLDKFVKEGGVLSLADLDSNEHWMTVQEVSEELGLSSKTINRALTEGKLKSTKVHGIGQGGYRHYISETAIIEYLEHKKGRMAKKEEPMTEPKKEATVAKPSINLSKITYSEKEEKLSLEKISSLIQNFMEDEIHKAYLKGFEEGRTKAREDILAVIKGVA